MAAKKKTAKKVESESGNFGELKTEIASVLADTTLKLPEDAKVELLEPRNLTRERIAQSKNAPLAAKMVK